VLRQIRFRLAVLVLFASLVIQREELFGLSCLVFDDIDNKIATQEHKYGIDIQYEINVDTVIPEIWRVAPVNGSVTHATRLNVCRYLPVLIRELNKYPEHLIKKNLMAIYLLGSLSFYDIPYGGTSLEQSIYLTAGAKSDGYNDTYFASLFHHEISSIFFRSYSFPIEEWSLVNANNSFYAKSNEQVLKAIEEGGGETEENKKYYQDGVLSKYGYSTLENDFNLYAEMLFTNPSKLNLLAETYPRIYQKSELIKRFYSRISQDI